MPNPPSQPVAILGFGRSGTTWLSDIVSKASGSAVLFEPLHPAVFAESRSLSYRSSYTSAESLLLLDHLESVINKKSRSPWLLRNHLPWPPHEIDPALTELIWREIDVLGFKSIRATLAPDWVLRNWSPRLLYIVRNPLAVVASIVRRTNFWEFGWPETYDAFIAGAFHSSDDVVDRVQTVYEGRPRPDGLVEHVATMWAITHAIALPKLSAAGTSPFFYEDFYDRPFETARAALRHLGIEARGMLPEYLFTPAMTTLRTLHGTGALKETGGAALAHDIFWRDTLTPQDRDSVTSVAAEYGVDLYSRDGSRPSTTVG